MMDNQTQKILILGATNVSYTSKLKTGTNSLPQISLTLKDYICLAVKNNGEILTIGKNSFRVMSLVDNNLVVTDIPFDKVDEVCLNFGDIRNNYRIPQEVTVGGLEFFISKDPNHKNAETTEYGFYMKENSFSPKLVPLNKAYEIYSMSNMTEYVKTFINEK